MFNANKSKNTPATFVAALFGFLIFIQFFSSCTNKERNGYCMYEIPDSTMIDVANKTTHVIHVGNNITNMPLCSQIATIDGKEKYLLLDETNIYIFDWNSGIIEDSISTKECGALNNYSGFTYISKDSIVVFNSTEGRLFIINSKGQTLSKTDIHPNYADPTKSVSTINGLNSCRISLRKETRPIVNGFILGCMLQAKEYGKIPVSEEIDMNSGNCKPIVFYPDVYTENNWATTYMNSVYTAYDQSGNAVYSFPILNKVLRYNADFTKCDTIIMQSRYDYGIKPCNNSQEQIEEDESLEKKYYTSQLSYADIVFDPYRSLYIRVVEHPIKEWKKKEKFIKPKSFIISDINGKVLSETPIVDGSKTMLSSNMHIYEKGLAIGTYNKDENNIYFTCFKINK